MRAKVRSRASRTHSARFVPEGTACSLGVIGKQAFIGGLGAKKLGKLHDYDTQKRTSATRCRGKVQLAGTGKPDGRPGDRYSAHSAWPARRCRLPRTVQSAPRLVR